MGLDLLDPQLHPIDGIVVGGEREGADLSRAMAPLALGMEKGQHVFGIAHCMLGAARGARHLRPIEWTANGFGDRPRHLTASEHVDDRIFEVRLWDAW